MPEQGETQSSEQSIITKSVGDCIHGNRNNNTKSLSVLGPLILATDLLLLFGGEVVGDVKRLTDLLGALSLNHVCHSLAANIQKRLDVQVVGCLNRKQGLATITLERECTYDGLNIQE